MTDEEYDALPGLTDEQKSEVVDFIYNRYESLIDNLTDEARGYLNTELNAKAMDEVQMHMECIILDMLKDQYEGDEDEVVTKEENIN